MTKSRYDRIEQFFRSHNKLFFFVRIIYKFSPYPVYVAYPLLHIYLIWQGRYAEAVRFVVVPAVTFVSVTVLRMIINRARPYEALDINPLIKKNKSGQSFPSRHAASVFIIAMAFLYVNVWAGIALFILGIIMCASRVLAGVHYISDVAAGAAIAVILGIFGFYII
ncbi:MAG: phosphatase PAP2 family protein [Ruminococcus sp.]|nr:phosphatase PAP2 family protein [Ruminococcus sp.]